MQIDSEVFVYRQKLKPSLYLITRVLVLCPVRHAIAGHMHNSISKIKKYHFILAKHNKSLYSWILQRSCIT